MRNILAHQHFGVDIDIIWKTIINDLPSLHNRIVEIIDQ